MSNRIAIVTGVSRLKGIGRAICLELAKRKCDIFFTYWTPYDQQMPWGVAENEPEMIQRELEELGVKCAHLELDLTRDGAIGVLFDEVKKHLGHPSVLINNATYSTSTSIENFSAEELDKHYNVNVRATTLLTIEFARQFKIGNGGRVVNLTSGQSLDAMSSEIAYAITKGTVETLTKTICHILAEKGITINSVNPGPCDSGWMDEDLKKALLAKFPMGRVGVPSDTAKLIGFLVSEDGEWITGQIIHSEGGFQRQA